MSIVYGIELDPPRGALPGFTSQLVKRTGELANAIDRDGKLVIVADKDEANSLVDYYTSKHAMGERCTLILLSQQCKPTAFLTDYGLISQNNRNYLYENMVTPFSIKKGEDEQIQMALLQIEEHLIATDQNIMYVDVMQKELMEGIARAYQIELSFSNH
ncbi:hypothetical protein [Guptibacillus algicola]|uniref:hypothetical protein n=1 Tax=Guptibacillus algicola TaxID=225844 RepID=UPI001CD4CC62|nr:hypothetical protein [Alkalihalobacillus algicola]MCA0986016.1 hypothetical protein [Alkalihalobacillus algicola]